MYQGWRVRKRKVLKVLLAVQLAVLLIGLPTLDWSFATVVVPLYLFSVAVLLFATDRYARDGDIEVIYTILGANLSGVVDLMRLRPDFASCYELTRRDQSELSVIAAKSAALDFAQRLFADHRIRDAEPGLISRRVVDLALLLLGALVGAVAQHRLAPPQGVDAVIWHHSFTGFIEHERYTVVIVVLLLFSAVLASAAGSWRMRAERRKLISYARDQAAWLLGVFLPADPEVRHKIRGALRSAAQLSAVDVTAISAVEQVTGLKITGNKRRATALGDIQWMMLLFDMGILLGAVLPPMLGIG